MNKLMNWLEKYITPLAAKLGNQRHLVSIRDGIIVTMPLIIVGSLFLIVANLPIPGFGDMMAHLFGEKWQDKLTYPVGATFDIIGLVVSFGVAYRLAERYRVDPVSAGVISLAAFILTTPHEMLYATAAGKSELVTGVLPVSLLSSKGIFIAMIFALISTEIYRIIVQKDITIKMPPTVPPAVAKSFAALIPAFAVLVVVWLIRLAVAYTPWKDIPTMISTLISMPLKHLGGGLGGILIAVFCIQLLWVVGLHGDAIVGSIMMPIWLALMDENRKVFMAHPHADLPNVVTSQFYEVWTTVGGSGFTIALVLYYLFLARSKQLKQLGSLAIGPAIFNINEPVIFGTPIVMNPMLIIPFIFAPLVIVLVTYLSMDMGLVAKPSGVAVPWTTPIFISGLLASGGKLSGAVIQLVDLLLALLIYYPFFRMLDKQHYREERAAEAPEQ
ncbi:PTS cellobiose transporter subunit IIC [Caenibacillus caldisaponilyticus]|uniref:PTS cellobiose transporter subunit IIC n=1 Tax=Caenibacillus caldisaponilyticus TaxID=1674942 RepID=UPI000988589D|nr:PTS cellobiose transporter subunit IIC [Caenibacillus caldisaponilyticus]